MKTFQQFLQQKISYFVSHFRQNYLLLDHHGSKLQQIDLSFDSLTDQYFKYSQLQQNNNIVPNNIISNNNLASNKIVSNIDSDSNHLLSSDKSLQFNQLTIKITDKHLTQFWNAIKPQYNLVLNLQNQDITDQSILALAELYENQMCTFTRLKLSGNNKISMVSIIKLGQALRNNKNIKKIQLHNLQIANQGINRIIELIGVTSIQKLDLGLISNSSLIYLAKNLENPHHLNTLWFGESTVDKWQQDGKAALQNVIRKCQHSKRLLSINLYLEQPIKHYAFISELNIITKKNRKNSIEQRQNEYKSTSLNPQHKNYYDPDNHNLNAYKFSVKSYLTNVFGSLLDEALYFLQKERRNQLRDEATFQITKEPSNQVILQDICTSDGSIIVLTKYLLGKIKEKEITDSG